MLIQRKTTVNLTQLNKLVKDFNINPDTFRFQGEHDVVYVDFDYSKLPNYTEWVDNEADEFYDKYRISVIEGNWGFFT